MALLLTIPLTTMTLGQHDFGPHNVATGIKQYVLTLDISGWTFVGGGAVDLVIESSADNFVTVDQGTRETVFNLPIPARDTNPANQLVICCPIKGTGARKVRLRTFWRQSLPISGNLKAN